MTRQIICLGCHTNKSQALDSRDVAMGWQQRQEYLTVICPSEHGYTIKDSKGSRRVPLRTLCCDLCGESISNTAIAVAITRWTTEREGTPGPWEKEYGTVLPEDAAKLAIRLARE